ncbi:peptidoglycan DD-metalloendopeptidase family protein [Candidatus Woesearchaeota archaeon]|nr:peptidoglycan DD-metalloendopeptidase family protein [Candidatus Woesearchaeota archaeon]
MKKQRPLRSKKGFSVPDLIPIAILLGTLYGLIFGYFELKERYEGDNAKGLNEVIGVKQTLVIKTIEKGYNYLMYNDLISEYAIEKTYKALAENAGFADPPTDEEYPCSTFSYPVISRSQSGQIDCVPDFKSEFPKQFLNEFRIESASAPYAIYSSNYIPQDLDTTTFKDSSTGKPEPHLVLYAKEPLNIPITNLGGSATTDFDLGFELPLHWDEIQVSSCYGNRILSGKQDFHDGIDLSVVNAAGAVDLAVYPIGPGTVFRTCEEWTGECRCSIATDSACKQHCDGRCGNFGNYIVIKHNDNLFSMYSHLDSVSTTRGADVSTSDVIGVAGNTGYSEDAHLDLKIFTSEEDVAMKDTAKSPLCFFHSAWFDKLRMTSSAESCKQKYGGDKFDKMNPNLQVECSGIDLGGSSLTVDPNLAEYSYIISDADFKDTTITVEQVEAFIDSFPNTVLKDTLEGKKPAEIIHDSAVSEGISPIVLLATLQKESSALTQVLDQYHIDRIAGCGCPDKNVCNPAKLGFVKQIECMTKTYRKNYEDARKVKKYPYEFKPINYGGACPDQPSKTGISTVIVSNPATFALFRYTPHTRDICLDEVGGGNHLFINLFAEYYEKIKGVPPVKSFDLNKAGFYKIYPHINLPLPYPISDFQKLEEFAGKVTGLCDDQVEYCFETEKSNFKGLEFTDECELEAGPYNELLGRLQLLEEHEETACHYNISMSEYLQTDQNIVFEDAKLIFNNKVFNIPSPIIVKQNPLSDVIDYRKLEYKSDNEKYELKMDKGGLDEHFEDYNEFVLAKLGCQVFLVENPGALPACSIPDEWFRACAKSSYELEYYDEESRTYRKEFPLMKFAVRLFDTTSPPDVFFTAYEDSSPLDFWGYYGGDLCNLNSNCKKIVVQWTPSLSKDILKYRIYVSNGEFRAPNNLYLLAEVSPETFSFKLAGEYTHVAVTAIDTSFNENTATAKPISASPSLLEGMPVELLE